MVVTTVVFIVGVIVSVAALVFVGVGIGMVVVADC